LAPEGRPPIARGGNPWIPCPGGAAGYPARCRRTREAPPMRRLVAALVILTFASTSLGADVPGPPRAVEALLVNGRIWTGDPAKPEAAALAFTSGRVLAVWTAEEFRRDQESIRRLGVVRTIDLGGKRVVPGFNDSHVHVLGGGERLAQVALK